MALVCRARRLFAAIAVSGISGMISGWAGGVSLGTFEAEAVLNGAPATAVALKDEALSGGAGVRFERPGGRKKLAEG